jgi:hypothetical protein
MGFNHRAKQVFGALMVNVWTKKKRVEKLRYMHRNPVKRGLAAIPDDWRWSSYRFYFLDESGPVRVNAGWGRFRFGHTRRERRSPWCDQSATHPSQKAAKDGAPTVWFVRRLGHPPSREVKA